MFLERCIFGKYNSAFIILYLIYCKYVFIGLSNQIGINETIVATALALCTNSRFFGLKLLGQKSTTGRVAFGDWGSPFNPVLSAWYPSSYPRKAQVDHVGHHVICCGWLKVQPRILQGSNLVWFFVADRIYTSSRFIAAS